MILFTGLTDYVIRNLLRSSFAKRSRELNLRLHGMIYPISYPAYRDILDTELGMTSEAQDLVGIAECGTPHLERLAFRANLYQRSRVNCRTYRAKRRNSFSERRVPLATKLKFEAALLLGRMGGKLGWENGLTQEYFRALAESDYVRDVCIPRLKKMRPSVLVSTSTDGFPDTPWLIAAGLLGIPRVVWIRSWDNITTKCELIPDAELFVVWSELMERELKLYFPAYNHRRILRIGTPQFDGHRDYSNIIPRDKFCARMGLDPRRPIVLYCTGGTHICQKEHLVIKDLCHAIEQVKHLGEPQLLIRLHPYFWDTNTNIYENIHDVAMWPRREDASALLGPNTNGLLDDYQIMLSSFYHQAVNVNIASTVTLDTAVFDRPIVNIAYDGEQNLRPDWSVRRFYREYEHIIQLLKLGAVDVAWNKDQLTGCLADALEHPQRRSRERQDLVAMECGILDGNAGTRLAEAMVSFLQPIANAQTIPELAGEACGTGL